MARRLFYLNEVIRQTGWIRGETAEHLRRVLRASAGQRYDLSDGVRFYLGELKGFGRKEAEFAILETREAQPPLLEIHLLASLIKFDHFEWMLEKATELGADRITPVCALRSEKGLEQAAARRKERWARITRESGQQCRRVKPPGIGEVLALKQALAVEAESRLWLEEEHGARSILDAAPALGSVAVLAGPEGGWDDREREQAVALGWTPVSLGPQVLRAETACLAALAVLNVRADASARTGGPTPPGER
jgi:16S rRNA (uracil1498-N3)-methyltransferase